jgi:hypothetical protein
MNNRVNKKICELINDFIVNRRPELMCCEIQNKYLFGITFQEIYGYHNTELEEYLNVNNRREMPKELKDISGISHTTISNKRNSLKNGEVNLLIKIKRLSARIVYILYTDGETLPNKISEAHGLEDPPTIENPHTDPETRLEAVRNWAEIFVNEIILPLTFHRTDPEYEYKRHIGLCAHSALQNIAPNDAANTASYLYDYDNIPSGASLITNINDNATTDIENNLPRDLIENLSTGSDNLNESISGSDLLDEYLPRQLINQFAMCYQNFFEYASELGFLKGKQTLAIDITKDPTTKEGGENKPLAPKSEPPQKSDKYGKYGWLYQAIAVVDSANPFVWNVSPLYSQSELQLRMAKQLESFTKLTDIDLDFLFADRGYYKTDAVEVCRNYFGKSWAINAKAKGDVGDLFDTAQEGEIRTGSVDFGSMNNPPHAFVYPNKDIPVEELDVQMSFDDIEYGAENITTNPEDNELYSRTVLSSEKNYHRTHTGYLTDKPMNEKNIRKIHALYHRRDAIESVFGQIKDTMMPYCESSDPAVRYYFAALGGLFYNMHALINRSYSPEYHIPLDITGKELLSAIRDVCLE